MVLQGSPSIRPFTSELSPELTSELPTVWGLDSVQLHDRYWASRAVCVVRPGQRTALPRHAELFMLTDVHTLAIFRLRKLIDNLYWTRAKVVFIRLRSAVREEYRENLVTDEAGRFLHFKRSYGGRQPQTARIALTSDRRVAELWQETDGSASMWREFRRQTRDKRRGTLIAEGRHYDRLVKADLDRMVTDLVHLWPRPSTTIERLHEIRPGVWAEAGTQLDETTDFLGPAWIGSGRERLEGQSVLGPAILWDDEQSRPPAAEMRWERLDPTMLPAKWVAPKPVSRWRRTSQRYFDIAFALAALLFTLPLYPLIMLAIWIEDGRPFLFAHKRETCGGREFPCYKFRSMRKDADRIKADLTARNQSDGPQFFMEDDPRVTRVGRFLRKSNLDELPQFINVLLGHMSVVGPRPSPRSENQCCPGWREARLSVRPGVTGLWQVSRTRREGLDFQEWIKFDIEYVERASWRLDLLIIFRTIRLLAGM